MTRKEATEVLKLYLFDEDEKIADDEKKFDEAVRMAIEALPEPINCVKCEHYTETEDEDGVKGRCKREKHQLSGEIPTESTNTPTDLISRQDAIDAVIRECEHICDAYDNVVTEINALPSADTDMSEYSDRLWKIAYERGKAEVSAEPKTEEHKYDHCEMCNMARAYQHGYETGQDDMSKTGWTPVTKDGRNFPLYSEFVLVWVCDGYEIASYEYNPEAGADFWHMDAYDLYGKNIWKVKAWCPLPEPYKGGEEDA